MITSLSFLAFCASVVFRWGLLFLSRADLDRWYSYLSTSHEAEITGTCHYTWSDSFLSLVFSSLNMISLNMIFFVFILVRIHWASSVCRLIFFFSQLGTFLTNISSNLFFCFILSLLSFQVYLCHSAVFCPTGYWGCLFFSITFHCFLCVSVLIIFISLSLNSLFLGGGGGTRGWMQGSCLLAGAPSLELQPQSFCL
jgi:hypothetical protein